MKKTIFYLIIILFPFICKGESDIEYYAKRMINDIRPLFQENDTIFIDTLKGFDDLRDRKGQNYNNLHVLTKLKDQYFFIFLSKSLMGSKDNCIEVKDPAVWCTGIRKVGILTSQEVDSIEKWWNNNSIYLSPDFLEDAVFSRQALPSMTRTRSIKNRLDFRRKMLQEVNPESRGMESKNELETNEFLKDGLQILQETFNQLYNTPFYGSIVESVVPCIWGQTFIYISRGLMSGENYELNTPVTREEFDEMKDWWFLNGHNIDKNKYLYLYIDAIGDIQGMGMYYQMYYDADLPDEIY